MTSSITAHASAPAIVIGLCVHGLALVRALHEGGVRVLALEANRALPGAHTRMAEVHWTADINGTGLIDGLIALRQSLPPEPVPVLYPSNDNMVRVLASHWERLQALYRLSWSDCRETVLRLLDKSALEAHCQRHDLPYPKTWILPDLDALPALSAEGLDFPLIVKPARPLSGFKVRLLDDHQALEQLARERSQALPFLLQHWVPGEDRRILFYAFYLDRGRILASFGGRKLASKPAALGQTIVAESFPHAAMLALAERFFAPLELSGPVSLEAKLDADGQPWIIEPTLGRTDYWLDCCVANGVNLPLIEHQAQSRLPVGQPTQTQGMIWFDTERGPGSYLRLRFGRGETATDPWRPRFAYWNRHDPVPSLFGTLRLIQRSLQRVIHRLSNIVYRK
ncbi:MAG: hypothetical protein VBE63_07675 [Lamprobacter sp.]|uniref:carboxylate--amine ligase n=1 Tax=Lamprobacter sp. TaxID=3100796 RepID=UPI002B2631BC|nr:hypothetical protein [Lamprobacter sp.]MEA3639808.1 hypothetical protein [Lamprobacter sp.]